jgi:putative hydrolase of the HAD superfamily
VARVQGIVSDYAGVLTAPLAASFRRYSELTGVPLEALGAALAALAERDGENPLFALERGEITSATFLERVGDEVSAAIGRTIDLGDFPRQYFAGLTPNEPMLDWLRRARAGHGLRLALLTNNVREWEPLWRGEHIEELFETIVDSGFVGLRKPDPRIYALTLERLGLAAEECVFVDDLAPNVATARELGFHAILFADAEQAIGEIEALLR